MTTATKRPEVSDGCISVGLIVTPEVGLGACTTVEDRLVSGYYRTTENRSAGRVEPKNVMVPNV